MMNRSLLLKLAAIAVLILLLCIPLMQIHGVVEERQSMRNGVLQEIAAKSSNDQTITGPLLVVPYRKVVREWKVNPKTDERYWGESEQAGRLYFLPKMLNIDSEMQTEIRRRGIYEARLYHGENRFKGKFVVPAQYGLPSLADYRFEPAYISVGVSDVRGIPKALQIMLNGKALEFFPGSQIDFLRGGIHASLPASQEGAIERATELNFSFVLKLQGTGRLQYVPVGQDTQVNLSFDWPHPSFDGAFLPVWREVTDKGFSASWQTSFFSTNMAEALDACVQRASCDEFHGKHFGVSLVDPVDQYLKTDRAIKYALLFIGLTFAGFFLFEILAQLALHPVQYALVGLALALFYLLLLSLSEHLGFAMAYLISASACVVLIGFYVCSILHSIARGVSFGAGLAGLYALLYGLLGSEDYSLLMGSILLFALLGVVMIITRKLDWYSIGRTIAPHSSVRDATGLG